MHEIKIRDEPEVLELAVVRRPGRKRKLTDAIFEKIMHSIEEGDRVNIACRGHGISERTLYVMISRHPEPAKRFAEAKQIRLQKWHEEWLGEMIEHSKRSPWATGFLLERNFPKLYALRTVVRDDGDPDNRLIGTAISEQQLIAYGRLMREFDQENEARRLAELPQLPDSE